MAKNRKQKFNEFLKKAADAVKGVKDKEQKRTSISTGDDKSESFINVEALSPVQRLQLNQLKFLEALKNRALKAKNSDMVSVIDTLTTTMPLSEEEHQQHVQHMFSTRENLEIIKALSAYATFLQLKNEAFELIKKLERIQKLAHFVRNRESSYKSGLTPITSIYNARETAPIPDEEKIEYGIGNSLEQRLEQAVLDFRFKANEIDQRIKKEDSHVVVVGSPDYDATVEEHIQKISKTLTDMQTTFSPYFPKNSLSDVKNAFVKDDLLVADATYDDVYQKLIEQKEKHEQFIERLSTELAERKRFAAVEEAINKSVENFENDVKNLKGIHKRLQGKLTDELKMACQFLATRPEITLDNVEDVFNEKRDAILHNYRFLTEVLNLVEAEKEDLESKSGYQDAAKKAEKMLPINSMPHLKEEQVKLEHKIKAVWETDALFKAEGDVVEPYSVKVMKDLKAKFKCENTIDVFSAHRDLTGRKIAILIGLTLLTTLTAGIGTVVYLSFFGNPFKTDPKSKKNFLDPAQKVIEAHNKFSI